MTTEVDHDTLVLQTLQALLVEVDPGRGARRIALDHSLTRDLALGSLERVELLLRLEQSSGISLPETVLAEADTARELATALDAASAAPERKRGREAIPVPATPSGHRGPATGARTLVDVLRFQVEAGPDRVHLILRSDEGQEEPLTYGELYQASLKVAAGLRRRGIAPGERVALLLRTEPAFFRAYVGILLAGGVPVPLYPPFRADQIEEYARRQAAILRNAEARLLLTFEQAERAAALLRPLAPTLTDVTTVDAIEDPDAPDAFVATSERDLALIQYTSGSTGMPKGVALSHANLLANIRAFGEAFAFGAEDVGVTWLPLYHDMGLIGTWFGPLYHGVPAVVMSPLAFLSRPVRWLEAVHTHRCTLSAAPNFAYDLCARKITDAELEGLDLSSWRCALNGAEAVMAATIERFTTRFAPYGLRSNVIKPVYGLAEGSLCVTAPPLGRTPLVDRLSREAFQRARALEPAAADDPQPLTFVACGHPIAGHEVRCVDASDRPVPDRREGRVHFRGPSTMQGYFANPEATAAVVRSDGWVDTGDLGYLSNGDLFITGRAKDVIIAGGRNIYPQEVEEAVAEVPGVRRGCVAAFGVEDARTGTERLVVVSETRATPPPPGSPLHTAVTTIIVETIGVPADVVVFVRAGSIPKTSSGKIRRAATRDLYVSGQLERGRASAARQWVRLVAGDVRWRIRRVIGQAGVRVYSAWVWTVFLLAVPFLWLAVLLARRPRTVRRIISTTARTLLTLGACRPRLEGLAPASLPDRAVLVANHASYLDVLVLLAVLPPTVRFGAKARLATYPVLGPIIRKSGYVQVQRGTMSAAGALTATLDDGDSLFIFPEGTFVRAPGTMPFRLGAFQAAVDRQRPVIPIALSGTRTAWPDETWLLRPTPLVVTIADPLEPAGAGWTETVRLRDAARAWIAARSGEPAVDRAMVILDGVAATPE